MIVFDYRDVRIGIGGCITPLALSRNQIRRRREAMPLNVSRDEVVLRRDLFEKR